LAPSLVEMSGSCLEPALLAVAAGAGIALLPESVADRYAAPGVRFVPIDGDEPVVAAAVVTRRDTAHLPTAAFVRALSRAQPELPTVASRTPLTAAA
jgi:DNA-binding transcriptional LysR family regulator